MVTHASGGASAARSMKVDVAFAAFWQRLLAYLIDATTLGGVYFSIFTAVRILAPDDFNALLNVWPVCSAIGWAYFAIFESSPLRGTLGRHTGYGLRDSGGNKKTPGRCPSGGSWSLVNASRGGCPGSPAGCSPAGS